MGHLTNTQSCRTFVHTGITDIERLYLAGSTTTRIDKFCSVTHNRWRLNNNTSEILFVYVFMFTNVRQAATGLDSHVLLFLLLVFCLFVCCCCWGFFGGFLFVCLFVCLFVWGFVVVVFFWGGREVWKGGGGGVFVVTVCRWRWSIVPSESDTGFHTITICPNSSCLVYSFVSSNVDILIPLAC